MNAERKAEIDAAVAAAEAADRLGSRMGLLVEQSDVIVRLSLHYPDYHWETNMGYATRRHIEAVNEFGPTAHHRKSFGPVAQLEMAF